MIQIFGPVELCKPMVQWMQSIDETVHLSNPDLRISNYIQVGEHDHLHELPAKTWKILVIPPDCDSLKIVFDQFDRIFIPISSYVQEKQSSNVMVYDKWDQTLYEMIGWSMKLHDKLSVATIGFTKIDQIDTRLFCRGVGRCRYAKRICFHKIDRKKFTLIINQQRKAGLNPSYGWFDLMILVNPYIPKNKGETQNKTIGNEELHLTQLEYENAVLFIDSNPFQSLTGKGPQFRFIMNDMLPPKGLYLPKECDSMRWEKLC